MAPGREPVDVTDFGHEPGSGFGSHPGERGQQLVVVVAFGELVEIPSPQ